MTHRSLSIVLSIILCSWASTSRATFMPTNFTGVNAFREFQTEIPEMGREKELCISPCFEGGALAYIEKFIFRKPNSSPGLLFPEVFVVTHHTQDLVHNLKQKQKQKQKRKRQHKQHFPPLFTPSLPDVIQEFSGLEFPGETAKELPPGPANTGLAEQSDSANQVPTPATLALFVLGLAVLGCSRRGKV